MPALGEASQAYTIEEWGLLYDITGSQISVPVGKSPACFNVMSYPGRVVMRPGITSVAATTSVEPVSIKEFVLQDATTRLLLMLDSGGQLSKESGTYTFSTVSTDLVEASLATALRMNSVTLFGREYMAFSTNGVSGVSVPLAYDNTDLLRVAPCGPGDMNATAGSEPGAGGIIAGVHGYRVSFLTKWGFITPPGPTISFNASGSKNIQLTNIPIGPAYVVGRIVSASAVADSDFYYIAGSTMVINDNTTTTVTLDYTDDQLIAGSPISVNGDPDTDLLNLIALPSQSSVFSYHNRLCWLGERSQYGLVGDAGLRGLTFDAGFFVNRPLGWSVLATGQAKGTGIAGATGDYLQITGDGATQQGCLENISNPATIIPPGTEVRVRVRCRKSAGATGTFHVIACHAGDPNTTTVQNFAINMSSLSNTEWRVIDGQVLSAVNNTIGNIPGFQWRMRISGGGGGLGTVLSNGGIVYIDYIEFYAGAAPYQPSLARWSKALQPDAYDALTGFQYVDQDNGQRLTSGFVLNETAYFVKERSLYTTRDDGAREPAFWSVSQISNHVGSPSAKGVGKGDGWVAIAGRAGLYYFDGGRPIILSDNIRNTWRRINWLYGNTIACHVDMDRKMILVSVPLDAATTPNQLLMFQFYGASPVQTSTSTFGTVGAVECSPWTTAQNLPVYDMATSERPDGTRHFLMTTGTSSGRCIVKIDDSAVVDTANFVSGIFASYRTAYMGDPTFRKLFTSLRMTIRGPASNLIFKMYFSDENLGSAHSFFPIAPVAKPLRDTEWIIRAVAERAAIDISTITQGDTFDLEKIALLYKEHPYTPQLGRRS